MPAQLSDLGGSDRASSLTIELVRFEPDPIITGLLVQGSAERAGLVVMEILPLTTV